jgi:hypothetical protein
MRAEWLDMEVGRWYFTDGEDLFSRAGDAVEECTDYSEDARAAALRRICGLESKLRECFGRMEKYEQEIRRLQEGEQQERSSAVA